MIQLFVQENSLAAFSLRISYNFIRFQRSNEKNLTREWNWYIQLHQRFHGASLQDSNTQKYIQSMTLWLGVKFDMKITFMIPGNTVICFLLEASCICFNEPTQIIDFQNNVLLNLVSSYIILQSLTHETKKQMTSPPCTLSPSNLFGRKFGSFLQS